MNNARCFRRFDHRSEKNHRMLKWHRDMGIKKNQHRHIDKHGVKVGSHSGKKMAEYPSLSNDIIIRERLRLYSYETFDKSAYVLHGINSLRELFRNLIVNMKKCRILRELSFKILV